jgi:tetratricopeptide (TPR) repeat protein
MAVARYLMASALLWWAAASLAQQGGDSQAQILYAYQTEDTNSLANLIEDFTTQVKADGSDASLRYHLAHALYRRGLLAVAGAGDAGAADAGLAESAFADCVDELKPLVSQDVKSAETLILQSACYSALANLRKFDSGWPRSRADERLKAALKLAPRNPRAVFLSSMEEFRQAKPGTALRQHAFAQLQLAAQLFDASPATNVDAPGWGHAEAYLALGRELQSRGDQVGARNWIEKSLIVAPDYKAAQRQLAQLVRH